MRKRPTLRERPENKLVQILPPPPPPFTITPRAMIQWPISSSANTLPNNFIAFGLLHRINGIMSHSAQPPPSQRRTQRGNFYQFLPSKFPHLKRKKPSKFPHLKRKKPLSALPQMQGKHFGSNLQDKNEMIHIKIEISSIPGVHMVVPLWSGTGANSELAPVAVHPSDQIRARIEHTPSGHLQLLRGHCFCRPQDAHTRWKVVSVYKMSKFLFHRRLLDILGTC